MLAPATRSPAALRALFRSVKVCHHWALGPWPWRPNPGCSLRVRTMIVPLVAILGAGASLGAIDSASNYPPPLTVNLFDEIPYRPVLSTYDPGAPSGAVHQSGAGG